MTHEKTYKSGGVRSEGVTDNGALSLLNKPIALPAEPQCESVAPWLLRTYCFTKSQSRPQMPPISEVSDEAELGGIHHHADGAARFAAQ